MGGGGMARGASGQGVGLSALCFRVQTVETTPAGCDGTMGCSGRCTLTVLCTFQLVSGDPSSVPQPLCTGGSGRGHRPQHPPPHCVRSGLWGSGPGRARMCGLLWLKFSAARGAARGQGRGKPVPCT